MQVVHRAAEQAQYSPSGALYVWTIYDHPTEFPHWVVGRKFYVGMDGLYPSDDVLKTKTLQGMREKMRELGLHRVKRVDGDDPKVVETWV